VLCALQRHLRTKKREQSISFDALRGGVEYFMVIKCKFKTRTHHFDNKKMLLDARQSSWAYLVVEAVISAEWCEVNYANVDFIEVTWGWCGGG
jgi:hypothetical protein